MNIMVAAASLNLVALDWAGNLERHRQAIKEARSLGVQLIVFPELSLTGYGCEDAFLSKYVRRYALKYLTMLSEHTQGLMAVVGLPIAHEGKIYNAVAVIIDGAVQAIIPKQHLAGDGVHYEPRWFSPWPAGQSVDVKINELTVPMGDLILHVGSIKFGIEICRDAWVKTRTGISLSARGAQVILNPTGSHFAFNKVDKREKLVKEAVSELHVGFVYSNELGNDAGRIIFDGDTYIADVEQYHEGQRLTFKTVNLLASTLNIDAINLQRQHRTSSPVGPCVTVAFDWQNLSSPKAPTQLPAAWQHHGDRKAEEMARAIALGLWDYLRKSKSQGFVISLSGGADSTACLVGVRLMLDFALQDLGYEGVKQSLSHIKKIKDCDTAEQMMALICACAYQATTNSSKLTLEAAQTVSKALGATFYHWSVQPLVDTALETLAVATNRTLDWKTDDITLQNIQARSRAPTGWLLANMRQAIYLCSSNRSEAAVGYATMDGDTSGGLSPLGGIDKAYLLKWLQWMQTTGPSTIGPMPSLSIVTQQAPTAELRPVAQTDEADLMPYELLTRIESLAIGEKYSPLEVFTALMDSLEMPAIELHQAVTKFFKLWARNQWKRERLAPAFHLDDKNLDPKTWCRFPILCASFETELAELDAYVNALSAD